jgi:mannan endo-1,4-beta-mannosidase
MPVPPLVPPARRPEPQPRPGRHAKGGLARSLDGATAVVARLAGTLRGRALVAATSLFALASVAAITFGVLQVATPIGLSQLEPSGDATAVSRYYASHPVVISLPAQAASYLGIFARGVPRSYAPVRSVTKATGVHPNIAPYYSGWYERFQASFAAEALDNGAVPFIQMDPTGINLTAIVAGAYDTYIRNFATQVAAYGAQTGHGVIISFGHEMNGYWYRWGYRHTSPQVFVAAWRRIVKLFRQQGADDVTWLWTTNIIDTKGGIPGPAPWWPGARYVTWIGIDGYYYQRSWTFASLFGPTIKAVRALTSAPVPVLIAETGAARTADQAAKIADLSNGVRAYGLLGFVWFDATGVKDWRLQGPGAVAALQQVARVYNRLGP